MLAGWAARLIESVGTGFENAMLTGAGHKRTMSFESVGASVPNTMLVGDGAASVMASDGAEELNTMLAVGGASEIDNAGTGFENDIATGAGHARDIP